MGMYGLRLNEPTVYREDFLEVVLVKGRLKSSMPGSPACTEDRSIVASLLTNDVTPTACDHNTISLISSGK